jgi:hypothetical protein
MMAFYGKLGNESDRAAVILVAARLDEMLRVAITHRLIPCPTSQDDLMRSDGPLGMFSSRIDAAYRLGLI